MGLVVYNTLTQKKEAFETLESGKVRMYCCGPTVYDLLHIGNFRGAVFYNVVRNFLEQQGYDVTYVYNFTDVDDKILNRAKEENVEPKAIAEKYIDEFWRDFNALKLKPHTFNPRVTEHIDGIVKLIERIIENGHGYVAEGEVFFSVKSFSHYGDLSGRDVNALESSGRIEDNPRKKDPLDFSLWKPAKEGEQSWDSPWGKGRPGWHIECSAMNCSILGEQIDIHGGGLDLVFPHHENEIAQSEAATGKHFAKYWLHNNLFTFGGQKMSKSLGNIRTMRSFLEAYNAEIYKFMVLSAHYRSPIDFSDATIEQTVRQLARIYSALSVATGILEKSDKQGRALDESDKKYAQKRREIIKKISDSLNDDFNTASSIAAIFELIREFNKRVKVGSKPVPQIVAFSADLLHLVRDEYGTLLALFQEEPQTFLTQLDDMLLKQMNLERSSIDTKVSERMQAREQKDFEKADQLRKELTELGIAVHDTPDGSIWEVDKK